MSEVEMDRRESDRRELNEDRRQENVSVEEERRVTQRRKVPRRRQIDPTTCERDYTKDEIEFMQSLDAYKRASGRMFPTCSEILEVVRNLGYIKLDDPLVEIVTIEDEEELFGPDADVESMDEEEIDE